VIYPTRRAIILAASVAPVALALGLAAPGYWAVAAAWLALILGLALVDALIGPARSQAALAVEAPSALGMADEAVMTVRATFARTAPREGEIAVETNARLIATPDRLSARLPAAAAVTLTPVRRGEGEIETLWLRWRGPLGLVWKQIRGAPTKIAVVPNLRAVKDEAIRLFSRDALFGIKTQLDNGDGSEFHALRELVQGMDPRTVDWRQSARHGKLLGKEFRTERNHPVVFAIDSGRLMCDPVAGVPRLDRALNAALLLAYVCLKLGDRVGVFAFDAQPRGFSGILSGARAFARLQRHVAAIDYGVEETNFTLGLTQLGAALQRRSLVVVFTDFADSTTAELMLENLGRLVRRHLVLFVVLRDEELEGIVRREPVDADAVSRAVTAQGLLRGREVVVGRLRRLGAHVIDAAADQIGPALISAYLDLKRRNLM
jgi:uncharacterized protein (DUF58 family)